MLSIPVLSIGRILKRKIDDIVGNGSAKRQKTVRYPELENALLEWILRSQDKIILTDNICSEKAKVFAQMLNIPFSDFKFSNGWLFKFKRRHGLVQIKKHGEDASADHAAAAVAVTQLRELLKDYELKDIYNMDETSLFYRYAFN